MDSLNTAPPPRSAWRSRLGLGGKGAATAVKRTGAFGRSGGTRSSRSRAAGKFRAAALTICSARRCAAGTYPIRKAGTVHSALVDRIGPNDGDAKLTSRFSTPNLIPKTVVTTRLSLLQLQDKCTGLILHVC